MKSLSFIVLTISLFTVSLFSQTQPLDIREMEDLKYLYEEERLACDVYTQLAKKWQAKVFVDIARSEKLHYEQVLNLLEEYGLAIPKNTEGFYNSIALNNLYDRFSQGGSSSLEDALSLSAQFEEYDIIDLETAVAHTENEVVLAVYKRLLEGSKQHLKALYKEMKKRGIRYEPALLSKQQFLKIVRKNKKSNL